MEETMKRTIVVTAALLAGALSAHAAPVRKHLPVANGRACHETLITRDNAMSYALGTFSGAIALPSVARMKQCFTRESPEAFARDNPHPDM
jgi:hypothetical protein